MYCKICDAFPFFKTKIVGIATTVMKFIFTSLYHTSINDRLLCELATKRGFPQFMADVEIIVDRIADSGYASQRYEPHTERNAPDDSGQTGH